MFSALFLDASFIATLIVEGCQTPSLLRGWMLQILECFLTWNQIAFILLHRKNIMIKMSRHLGSGQHSFFSWIILKNLYFFHVFVLIVSKRMEIPNNIGNSFDYKGFKLSALQNITTFWFTSLFNFAFRRSRLGNRLACKRFGAQTPVSAQCSTNHCESGSDM